MKIRKKKTEYSGALLFMLFFLANFFLYKILFLTVLFILLESISDNLAILWVVINIATIGIIYLSLKSSVRFFFKLYVVSNLEKMKSIVAFLFFLFLLVNLLFYSTVEYAILGLLTVVIHVPVFYIILDNQVSTYIEEV